jgi:hypothetical protein
MRAGLVTVFVCLILAAPAVAQEDGVFVDPDSPAGKEYAIPLEEARRHGAGGGAPGTGQPLFGAGIEQATPPVESGNAPGGAGGSASSGAGGSRSGKARANGDNGTGGSSESSEGNQAVQRSAAINAAASGSSDGLITAAIVALVLAAGLLAGVALRRALTSD